MKKLYTSQKFKRRQLIQAKFSKSKRTRFTRYRKHKNSLEGHLSCENRKDYRYVVQEKKRGVNVVAPENFCFVDNPEEVCRFIQEIEKCYSKRKQVFVVLCNVNHITYDAITVLLSVVVRFKVKKIPFNGDKPRDMNIRRILVESGFFDCLYRERYVEDDRYKIASKNGIITHARRNVDSELSSKVIDAASKTIWGNVRRCPKVQRSLIELMQNTNNHAAPPGTKMKHWWLSVRHFPEEQRVIFNFVDYGVGIFHSLRNKPESSKFFDAFNKLKAIFSFRSDSEVLKLILQGELHKTCTGKSYRGKGLPGVYEANQKKAFSNFHIISNSAFFSGNGECCQRLKTPFDGTFVTWEINASNHNLLYDHENNISD